MKYSFGTLALLSVFALASCDNASSKIKDDNTAAVNYNDSEEAGISAADVTASGSPAFEFNETTHDFGDVEEGRTVQTVFTFTNTGDAPLIISNAKGSCGCTVPEWPRTPIQPGETGEMKVSFNSSNKSGMTQKRVTITANTTPPTTVLNIKANVINGAQ
ncbi:DUF1573 domain-containing protein [Phaeocystidibacter luteus]|uniref:DUF1573 domain-containing protein n=1 Tax=Phaeocystidibacter luteus TaxID=911197 RepID=A0A6N6RLY6_9FLAO|nr:DUF1573 domain-containing protein [Phaeocystidibacter luteus]KAB2814601.1 DUF1573 domain-containing protein [Phaeocystidibacter luteus]